MKFDYDFSVEKDEILKETRGLGFRDIIQAIESGKLLDNKSHPNKKKYPRQKLFVVKINTYIYAVPYVVDKERKLFFLKTFYPSKKLTKKHEK
jgi:hypothetical protein